MAQTKKIIIIAGEASGDLHAAELLKHLKEIDPSLKFEGLGGPLMKAEGVELYEDLTKIAVVGFVEVIKHYKHFKKLFNLVIKKVKLIKPSAVILVDYPGFNLRLAKELKKTGTKIIYYISPQVWAWKENRVKSIRQYIDKMLVLFSFEKDFYTKHNVDVEFVGHPLLNTIKVKNNRETFLASQALSLNKTTIGLLPGSRLKEVQKLLPAMIDAAKILSPNNNLQFILIQAPSIDNAVLQSFLEDKHLAIKIIKGQTYDAINACDFCWVASGTATLETAILEKPMVIVYKTSFLTWILAKLFVKIPNIGLANIVAGEKIVPECIQFQATGQKIAQETTNILFDSVKLDEIKLKLSKIKYLLGNSGASERAARVVMAQLHSN